VTDSPNVELVRSIYADWERGNFHSVEWADPEIEYVRADGPDAGSRMGVRGMAHSFREWLSAWTEWGVKADEYLELDGGRVLVLTQFSARGKRSGLEVEQVWTKSATLFHVRGGVVSRLIVYWDREHALADLGLAEEDQPA
jgi:ketosteroid isomerase-like protein